MAAKVRVRFAPSPTGPLHVGGVRTALYNYLFAKKHQGEFLLRIEDTDQTRYVPGAEQYIIDSLKWAGLDFDEGPGKEGDCGPYRQSERKGLYKQYAEQLVANGKAYYAFDTTEELDAMRERLKNAGKSSPKYDMFVRDYMINSLTLPADEVAKRLEAGESFVIRIKIPRKEEIKFYDEIRGWVSFQSNQLDDKVIFKSDGMPTYHLANIVDDHLMNITHVIRGEEWLPSAPTHQLLYQFMGWEAPKFAHLPLILKPDGHGKLSKRDGDRLGFPVFPLSWELPDGEKITGYRESGYLPEAFVNILVMLGWNPGTNQEVFTMQELIDTFSLERVGKSGAKFDPDKAKWYNQQFLRTKDNALLASDFMLELEKKSINVDQAYVEKVIGLVKEKASFNSDFWSLSSFFFNSPIEFDKKVISKKWNDNAPTVFNALVSNIENLDNYNADEIHNAFVSACEDNGAKPGQYMQLLRVLVSGQPAGPAIFEMLEIIGKEEVIARINNWKEVVK